MTQSSSSLQVSLSSSLSSSPYASLDPLLSQSSGAGLTLENSIYSLSHNISDNDGGQKITLLTRAHNPSTSQSPLSSSPLTNCLDDTGMSIIGPGGVHPISFDDTVVSRMGSGPGGVHPVSLLSDDSSPQLLPMSRDAYFDSEDPSVNLHEFIVTSLQAQKNRVILLQLEEEFLKYIADNNRTEPLKLPSWDSYHRMLAHRVAAYFGLEHNVDPLDKTSVVVQKGPSTRIPRQQFSEHIPVLEESDGSEPKLILKRIRGSTGSEKFDGLPTNSVTEIKSFEEREEEYEKARARIFSQSSSKLQDLSESTNSSFDLFNSMSLRSTLRAPMSHRRTFSDTAFTKLFHQKELKQGPSSSGNSPSNTPSLFFPSLSPPPSLTPPAPSSPTIGVAGIVSPPHQITTQDEGQISQNKKSPQSHNIQPTTTFLPVYPSQPTPSTIPVVYHHQPAMVNPPWYYNHMVLYPISPHPGYSVPAYPSMVNSPILQPYPNAVMTHPLSNNSPRMGGGVRISNAIPEPMTSPTLPGGVVFRPLSQSSTVQIKPEEYPLIPHTNTGPLWNPPIDPVHYTGYQPHQIYHSGTVMGGVSHLAEQMEKNLSLNEVSEHSLLHSGITTDNGIMNDRSKMSPIVQRHVGRGNGRGLPGVYGYPVQPGMEPVLVSPTALAPPPGQFLPPGTIPTDVDNRVSYPPTNIQLHDGMDTHSTPTMSHIPHHHPAMGGMMQPQAMFSHSGSLTHSPVQILGHSLSTSIFSPPPSAGPPTLFISGSGKPGISHGSPAHAPVGSGAKLRRYSSPKQPPRSDMILTPQSPRSSHPPSEHQLIGSTGMSINDPGVVITSSQQLPPRLVQRGTGGGNRYQNQRHPINRPTMKGEPYIGGNMTHPYTSGRREPLLPTPSEMIKLDTGITAGVPVNVMEVINPPHEENPEYQILIQRLNECGAQDFQRGIMNRNTEIMVVIFESPETALQGLKQCVLPVPAKLSIPLPNHARYILQMLSA